MALGEVVAAVAEIAMIVKSAQEIIDATEEIMKDVASIIRTLNESAEGGFRDQLNEKVQWLQKVFAKLVESVRSILRFITSAMESIEKADTDGANLLKTAFVQ